MSEKDLPPEVIAEIVRVLKWVKAHPRSSWLDDPEVCDIYQKWRDLIRNDLDLLDGKGTQRDVDGLTSYGELFLLKHDGKSQATPTRPRGRPEDPTIDREQDRRIMDAWQSKSWPRYEDLANELGLPTREVEWAIDREEKRRAKTKRLEAAV